MSRRPLILALCIGCVSAALFSQAAREDILTVRTVLQLMEERLGKINDLTAQYELVNGPYRSAGNMFYKKPFFIRMNSTTDYSQIVSNGKTLWVFLAKFGVVAEQELIKSEKQYQLMLNTSEKSLRHLQRDYSFQFAPGGRDDAKFYILDLAPRVTKIGFKSIRMWVDRESGIVTSVKSRTINNVDVDFNLKDIKLNQNLEDGMFWFGVGEGNVQVIRNTILPVDIYQKRR
jgi:outer membrane lipoprotein-sorting protein